MAQMKVIVVDDEPSYRKALERTVALIPECELVAVSEDGESAFEAIKKLRPDVVLTDISMPRMNGIELTDKITDKYPNIQVVILTVNEDDETIYEAFRAGAIGYLLKTSTPNEVIDGIRAAFKGEAKITPKVAVRLIKDFRKTPSENTQEDRDILALSHREQEILMLIGDGLRNKVISEKLSISEKTVKNHVSAILKSLRVSSRTEAAMRAAKHRRPGPK